ncbi:glycosyltransferase family 2 protein [Dactylosporangium sp. CA-092794]|uniref:glycosyltransferase family 2 protein n=1 Tax=Dactylosporangium sp. CA-092794 TaxID=3239929 RepID=UPI003D8BF89A
MYTVDAGAGVADPVTDPLHCTAIVVTYNSAGYVAEALTALLATGMSVRVVDNASPDGTAALVAARFPQVDLIVNDTNAGFARAVNQAMRRGCADVVLLVNPDCVVPPDTARALVRYVRDRPSVGIAGPRLVGTDGRVAISAHPFESLATVVASRFGGTLVPVGVRRLLCGAKRRRAYDACRRPREPHCVDWLAGACLAVRTELLVTVGGLDDGYFLYYEDEELCLRAWQQAYSVVYVPTVQARHTGGASSRDPAHIWPHLYRSMLLFFARHRRPAFSAVRLAVLVRALLGIGLAAVRSAWHREDGAARARAWAHILRIAYRATPESLERRPCAS